ncbi:MAG: uroporphyrinogen-III synthase [Acidobacteriota bacterium]
MSQGTLSGRSILVTQGKSKSARLRRLLEEGGARVTEIPLIEVRPLESPQLEQAIQTIPSYHWIAFTSANGVRIFAEKAARSGAWPPEPQGPRLAVVGPGTEAALKQTGARADLVARLHQAEGLLEDLAAQYSESLQGMRILLPLAALARPHLAEGLKKEGAEVDAVPVYDTVPAQSNRPRLNRLLKDDPPDLITLASSSAARNLVDLCDDLPLLRRLNCVAIGTVTARTARQCGLCIAMVAETSSLAGMIEAIEAYFRMSRQDAQGARLQG